MHDSLSQLLPPITPHPPPAPLPGCLQLSMGCTRSQALQLREEYQVGVFNLFQYVCFWTCGLQRLATSKGGHCYLSSCGRSTRWDDYQLGYMQLIHAWIHAIISLDAFAGGAE